MNDDNFLYQFVMTDTALGSDGTCSVIHTTAQINITPNDIERDVDGFQWISH
jgi:hypothetical protein